MGLFAATPEPPYYAVIFTSARTAGDRGYTAMAEARDELGISVSYWSDLESIRLWKANLAHRKAQKRGREAWYSAYRVRISKVERDYGM